MKSYLIVLLLAAVISGCKQSSGDINKPNIIFILADDLGYGDLGCYGQEEIHTPNLDRLAGEGMRFTRHYAGSTVCAPSRCTLMTGMHTGHSAIRGNAKIPLSEKDVTVASLLRDAGYRTGLIGKWGLGEVHSTGFPNKKGFDYFFGYLSQLRAHNYFPDYLWRNSEKIPLDNEIIIADRGYAKGRGTASSNKKEYSHDMLTAEAMDFIDRSAGSPFFLYLAYTIPHANNEYWLVAEHGMEVPGYGEYGSEEWPEAQKGLAAMISLMDRDIGNLRKKLESMGIDKNTVLLFSSDNGPHAEGNNNPEFFKSSGGLRGKKRDLYEGGIRVPLIACWPGKIKPGISTDHISAFWDFLPTACDIAGIQAPESIDGISFLPELLGEEQAVHEQMYWEFHEQGGKQALLKGDWKLVVLHILDDKEEQTELYNLNEDPSEENDVSEAHPEMVAEMKALLVQERVYNENFPFIRKK